MSVSISIVILLILFIGLMVLGVPIAVSMALSSLIPMFLLMDSGIVFISSTQNVIIGMSKYSLIGIPLFVLSGAILSESGLARKLVDFAKLFVGWIPGSLLHINIVGNMFFGALSGSSIAAASSIGKTLAPIEREEGYDPALSAAANIASGPTGFLIPPNSGAIIFATLSNGAASVTALFLAGYIPGIMLGLSAMLVCFFYSKKYGYGKSESIPLKEKFKVFIHALPVLFLMYAIIGGITGGVFTPSEASGVAAFYSFILALCYRALTVKKFFKIIRDTANTTATILYLIGCSYILSWYFSYAGVPLMIGQGLTSLSSNPTVILLLISLALFILGMFMDVSPITTIFTPIFLPITLKLGVHPIHFATIMTLCSCIGVCTPPVGNLLYVGAAIGEVKVENVLRFLWPMIGLMVIGTLIVIFMPELTLFIPRAFGII